MKKFLAFAVAFGMLFGCASVMPKSYNSELTGTYVSAEVSGDYTYALLSDGTAKITKYNGKAATLTIPSKIGGKTVSCIGSSAFKMNYQLKSIVISNGIKNIEDNAFFECALLQSVSIPQSVVSLGNSAFKDCISLSQITLSNGIKSIGSAAFWNCKALKSVTLPASVTSVGANAFYGCRALTSVSIPGSVKTISQGMFEYCSSLKSAVIQSGVTNIADHAFSYCTSLASVSIPSSVKNIGDSAFENCTALTKAAMPNSVISIGDSAFWNCTSLEQVSFGTAVSSIGTFAFNNTKWLENLRQKSSLVIVNGILIDARSCKNQKITVPNTVKIIANGAFLSHETLIRLVLPSSLSVIGDYACHDCKHLNAVEMPASLKKIGNCAFSGCDNLTNINIPDKVSTLGKSAFSGCKSLKTAVLGSGISQIDDYTFENCISLYRVTHKNNIKQIGSSAFFNCKSLVSFSLPDTLTSIGSNSFSGCAKLENINVSDSVRTIGNYAFADCNSIKKVVLPNTVGSIGYRAFGYYSENNKINGFRIVCFKDTKAHEYAVNNGFAVSIMPEYERIYGKDRYATAVNLSKNAFSNGAETVVVVSGEDFADGLAGASLAKAYNAPILLCSKNKIGQLTLDEIVRLKAKKAIILGGVSAVSSAVENQLLDTGLEIQRITGRSRRVTSINAAKALREKVKSECVFFVNGSSFADALSASGVSAVRSAPIIFVNKDQELDDETLKFINEIKSDVKYTYIIGGDSAVSEKTKESIDKAFGFASARIKGSNRFNTSTAVNKAFRGHLSGTDICIAIGNSFPDALAGGVFAAMHNIPLQLVDKSINNYQADYLKSRSVSHIYVLGGNTAIPDKTIISICECSAK